MYANIAIVFGRVTKESVGVGNPKL